MYRIALAFAASLLINTAYADITINKSIRIADGTTTGSSLTSINGSVNIGSGAEVQGGTRTINGGIKVGDDSRTEKLSSINGRLRIGDRVTVDGNLQSINGTIKSGEGTLVTGSIETVNGDVDLAGTTIHKDLETVNGSVILDGESLIQGDLIVKKSRGSNHHEQKPLEITIRRGSVIEGDIEVLDKDRKVVVRLSDGGIVMGEIRGAEVIR